jgi:hypothetical protein
MASGNDAVKPRDAFGLALITGAGVAIHGYHPGAEDAEIYAPLVKRLLDPSLYPLRSEFFISYGHVTLYPQIIAASLRITHLPYGLAIFIWHLASIFLLLAGCWYISRKCFRDPRARWGSVITVAVVLTIPVAGTALYIADQYLNPRNLSVFSAVFAIANSLEKKYVRVALWVLFAAAVHPLMAVFTLSYIAVLILLRDIRGRVSVAACLLPLGISLQAPSAAYREAIRSRHYFFLLQWKWYEWLGIFAPLVLLWWLARIARKHNLQDVDLLCRAAIIYQAIYLVIALMITVPDRLMPLVIYQPLRSLLIVYVILFISLGGLLGQFVLRNRIWVWALLFVPLSAGMFFIQRQLFPATPQIEWPGVAPSNDWLAAFDWVRANAPHDAVFALNPNYMRLPGEDHQGFRALAERSRLADAVKDSGASAMFPSLPMAEDWRVQIDAERSWNSHPPGFFDELHRKWGVTWVILDQPGVMSLDCPYSNSTLRVCRLN